MSAAHSLKFHRRGKSEGLKEDNGGIKCVKDAYNSTQKSNCQRPLWGAHENLSYISVWNRLWREVKKISTWDLGEVQIPLWCERKLISCPRQTVHHYCFGNIYQNIKYQSAKYKLQNCESFCTSNMTISIVLQLKEISFSKLCAFLSTSDISYQGSLRKFHLKSMDNHIYDFWMRISFAIINFRWRKH